MKLLIELPSWIGDTVMATPSLVNLINHFEAPKVTLIGSFVSNELIKNNPFIEESIILNKNYIDLYNSTKDLGQFDIFISYRGSLRTKIMKKFISSKFKYQFDKKKYIIGHTVEKYNCFINDCIGSNYAPGKLVLKDVLNDSISKNKKTLGLNPGATYGNAKRWYPEEFAKVAVSLSMQYDIIILGSSEELEIANQIENYLINNNVTNFQNFAAKTSISELLSIIKNLDLLVTGDSGPMHIAAAFQIPTVSIFGPTKDEDTRQWMNDKSIVVKKNLECQPCMRRVCPLNHHNCMRLIKSSEVLGAIKEFD